MIKIEDINLLEQGYKLVFDLRSFSSILMDENYIKNIQQTTLDKGTTIGLKGDKGLYATAEWWENIKNGNIETYCVKGVIVGINQENPFIEENTMITIKVNGTNKEIFQDIVFTSEREKTISKELYKAGNEIVSIYILDKLKEDDVWNWVVEEKLGVSPLLNRVYIKGRG
ncbi:hypothetical protein [Acinetobacter baumannii]|uniref:hypothetical protein n=4 Tax=Acinetobacter baumannii TaxID=470 RepID=UPI00028E70C3|nr:hypothetical protein [Acinetobacter baumannii]AGQ07811.1 hypothetical protein BJAB0715_03165 [Acinetobacter baumannii BJAB0715]AIY36073.1 hypothetical protein ABLAC_07180 [Acinetobacter baumannii LAC-4]AKQ29486.1 hypothetical protein ACX61_03500 [Acinetobacter baumannii]AMN02728.1 hypothetical protein AZE33_16435 [Acinetobacter baumannii]APO60303.1 hypothetical protein BBX32_18110 [Acinetobacter baumannii]